MAQPRNRIFRSVFPALLAAALMAGCAGSGNGPFVGVWGDTSDAKQPSLDLKSDGTATGTDGCNRLTGSWKEDGKTISFGGFASTRMACEGVDTWLSNAATAKIQEDGKLAVFGQGGDEIGTLTPGK
ncbi:META domain-containing protein [Paenarthrobacter aurescens]|uniref:META domain-containing protein n=1 Tax=Paenarthrobacter aurescens TaxID=43663 RepID=A0A4Y3NH13_PAEAU|nr:META domain-containing protein [Paenarthrobacter aurescens]MDO6142052.1 META domain-containing protein [Paenarthrobacter aurescens]MDO6145856.1 META domain-containing protein [Paenarthrobacter aurescens]MDO6157101.1 META domain-containing protein [Paenarthrobacter aurescens]MDO6161087.1 META domain-containing protein [Paenarthrobacter aurescens]GEB20982.1 META domain-containing protein [Paenarthrobacter aurescens]